MLNENLDIFTQNEFSSLASINGYMVHGIFDDYYDSAFGYSSEAEGRKYCLKIKSSLAAAFGHGALVEFENGRKFELINKEPCAPDGKLTDLILKEL